MQIDKQALKNALEIVKPGLANKEVVQQSTSFAFIKDRVITYNDEISISHPVKDMQISGAIHAEELYQLLGKIKQDSIDIKISRNNELILSSGRMRAGFILQKEVKLPLLHDESYQWKTLPDNFTESIKFASSACLQKDMMRPVLTCVYIDKDIVIGSDNYRIAKYKLNKTMRVPSFLLPIVSAKEVSKLQVTKVSAENEGWIHFSTEENTIISCRTIEDKYPDISSFFDVEGTPFVMPIESREILDKVTVFSKRDLKMDEHVIISIANNKLIIESESEFGWINEETEIDYTKNPITFSITPYLLENILSEPVVCKFCKDRLKFEGENWVYITMLRETNET